MSFSFGFSGDDIEKDDYENALNKPTSPPTAATAGAFPIPGKSLLPPTEHSLADLLSTLPSKIAYNLLEISLGGIVTQERGIELPRRELWDVKMQIMAEDDKVVADEDHIDNRGLGKHDVRTGLYEGGFKSWECGVDLVKVLATQDHLSVEWDRNSALRVVELGCGTGLPSLALFQWIMTLDAESLPRKRPCSFILADYNPSVLRLATLPNFLLAWALHHRRRNPLLQHALDIKGELELSPEILQLFQDFLSDSGIGLYFISGAWSPELAQTLYGLPPFALAVTPATTLLLAAETIYSPFALRSFTDMMFAILEHERSVPSNEASAYVAAKRLYFGVGGSLTDFVDGARERGATVTELREETEGVRRGVVRCILPPSQS